MAPTSVREAYHNQAAWINVGIQEVVNSYLDAHMCELSGNEIKVLLFVSRRTLAWGKAFEFIPVRHFLEGVQTASGGIISGINLSKNTLLKCLRSLVERGALECVRHMDARGADLSSAYRVSTAAMAKALPERVFEHIKARLLNAADSLRVAAVSLRDYLLLSPEDQREVAKDATARTAKIARSKAPAGAENDGKGGFKNCTPKSSYYVTTIRKETTTPSGERSAGEEPMTTKDTLSKLEAIVQGVKAKHEEKRQKRATKVNASGGAEMKHIELHAMFDVIRASHPALSDQPAMRLTIKQFGILRKRLQERPVPKLMEVMTTILANWTDFAEAYNYGLRQAERRGDTVKVQDMPLVPCGSTLALRWPWLLTRALSHRVGSAGRAREAEHREAIQKVQKERDELAAANRRLSASRRTTIAPARPRSTYGSTGSLPTLDELVRRNEGGER